MKKSTVKKSTIEFIKEANEIHNNFYDYSITKYNGNKSYIDIICPVHGVFTQRADSHLKSGCKKCFFDKIRMSKDDFIKKAMVVQGNRYDYSLVDYINCTTNVKIVCPLHGIFNQTPDNHLSKRCGCPYCNESQGEKKVSLFLEKKDILFKRQYRFDHCKDKKPLPFDFFLPDYNICIEYDGKQHFSSDNDFGKNGGFLTIKIHDNIKNDFCRVNGIKLIRIRYDQDVDKILKVFF